MTPDDGRPLADLYESDFFAWTEAQARALRSTGQPIGDIDSEHLAEEVEGLGQSELRACESYVTRILEHLLKLEFMSDALNAPHWAREVAVFRRSLDRRLTPTISRKVQAQLPGLYSEARAITRYYPAAQSSDMPHDCPYSWDDILGRRGDWLPPVRQKD